MRRFLHVRFRAADLSRPTWRRERAGACGVRESRRPATIQPSAGIAGVRRYEQQRHVHGVRSLPAARIFSFRKMDALSRPMTRSPFRNSREPVSDHRAASGSRPRGRSYIGEGALRHGHTARAGAACGPRPDRHRARHRRAPASKPSLPSPSGLHPLPTVPRSGRMGARLSSSTNFSRPISHLRYAVSVSRLPAARRHYSDKI